MENIAKNIGTLYNTAEQYSKTSLELIKLNVIDKSSDVISSLAVIVSLSLILAVFSLFFNIGIALLLGKAFESYAMGFFIVSGFYLLIAIVVYIFRKSLIKIPIDTIVVKKLMKEKDENYFKQQNNNSN
jgi:predicted membrane channel-forming protein YqfA (hemolysin III family)